MKTIFLILSLLILASCEEEVQMYDRLTPDEQGAIRDYSAQKCKDTVEPQFVNFKTESLKVFDSTSYDRAKGFYLEYKAGNDVKRKMDIRIWKRDANADVLYFYITETLITADSYFFRVTRAQNEEIIDDIKEDLCARNPSRVYDGSTSSTSATIKYEYNKSNAPNTDYYVDTYALPFTSPAMFANFRLSRTVTTKKTDGTVVGTAVSYTSTLTNKTFDFEGHNTYSTGQYTQKFCEVAPETTGPDHFKFSQENTFFGFKTTCVLNTKPADWDLTIP